MNIFDRDKVRNQPPEPNSHDKRLRLLVVLLVILGGSLAFLASPLSEKTLGVKLSSLFSSANLISTDEVVPEKTGDQVFDCIQAPCEDPNTTSRGEDPNTTSRSKGSFECLVAPCSHPDLAILNPDKGTIWKVGEKVKISWDGIRGNSVDITLQPQVCNSGLSCPEIKIATDIENKETYVWAVPENIAKEFIESVSRLRVTIDDTYYATASVSVIREGQTPSSNGLYIYFRDNPLLVYKIENGTKRPLPFKAQDVIRCLGDNPSLIEVGNQVHVRMPVGEPVFCNPADLRPHRSGSLLTGFPDSDRTAVYLVEGNSRRPFPSGEVFECLGYNWNDIEIANTRDLNLPIGTGMTCDDQGGTLSLEGNGTLPGARVNVDYNTVITARGGNKPYTFSLNGVKPPVNKIEIEPSTGQINARFTAVGTYTIVVQVKDARNRTAEKEYTVQVTEFGSTSGGGNGGGSSNGGKNCVDAPTNNLVALYRFYHAGDSDHYYSTSSATPAGYQAEGITAYIYSKQEAGTVPLYQSYNLQRRDHYYTTDLAGAQTHGYRLDGIIGYVYPEQVSGSTVMYRMYNHGGEHYMMTTSTVERDAILSLGFVQQGNVGYTCGVPRPGSEEIAVYRLWSPGITDHFYTTSVAERDTALQRGYVSEGIAGYVLSVPGANRVPIYRSYSSRFGNHFYTTNEAELNASGYSKEGILGFVYTTPSNDVIQLYRLYNGNVGDHFYTTSTAERDNAVQNGYRFEGTIGYMP